MLGAGDFAVRRRQSYNTILIDRGTRKPVDVLPGREAAALADWLRGHPEVKTVCRDRAGAYAEGIRTGAPQAIQVADRFHLWKNVCEAAEKTVAAHHRCLRAAAAQADPAGQQSLAATPLPAAGAAARPGTGALPARTYPLAERTRAQYAAVHECLAQGLSRSGTARELNLDIQTVRRFAAATCAEELLGKAEHRLTSLDPYIDLVNQRWNEGMTNAATITAELRALGFKGDTQTVRRYLRPFRLPGASPGHPDPAIRTRTAASRPRHPGRPETPQDQQALLTRPDRLTEDDALIVKNATDRCACLRRLHQHVRSFSKIMTQRRGQELPAWIEAVEADELPELRSLAPACAATCRPSATA